MFSNEFLTFTTLFIFLGLTLSAAGLWVFLRGRRRWKKRNFRLEKVENTNTQPKPPTPLRPPLERIENKELEAQQQQQDEEKVVGLRILGFWTDMVISEKMNFIKALLDLESIGMKATSWVTKVKAQEQTEVVQKTDPYYFRKLAKSRSSRKGGMNRF